VEQAYQKQATQVKGFVSELNQVWTNLIDNAIDAMDEGGTLTISSQLVGDKLEIRFQDNGSGIPPELQHYVFDPFFTTKDVGKGTGLELDIIRKILNWHRAEIYVESQPDTTIFSVRFHSKSTHPDITF
jgi:signal transduction histidine kinase